MDLQKIIENLVDAFLSAGDLSLQLRDKGLSKEIKSDNTPVSNGDIEVNNFISSQISRLTPDIPIISEETSENKDWGIGQVQSIIKDKVTVNFENAGKKVINAKNIELKKIVK